MANRANSWWKRSAEWVTGLKNKPTDLFTVARIKIAFWYALVGVVILAVGGYLVYAYIIYIIGDIIHIIQALIQTNTALSEATGTIIITQAINGDLTKMSIAVGLWIIFTMALSAYVLAEIILWPIRRAMERERQFIANVSHELRTPLSVMRTNSEVALMGGADVTPREELVEAVKSNLEEVDRMAKITQFLLNFSNMENRMSATKLVPVDLAKVCASAAKSMETIAAKKGVTLQFTAAIKPAVVRGSAIALEEMVTNLLKNAIAYTPTGGKVAVGIAKRGSFGPSGIVLSVEDTGMGIPADDLPNIFDAFYRGHNAVKGGHDSGSGLGLAIVKEIAELHRATISAKSTVGKGTAISARFPVFHGDFIIAALR